MKPKSGWLGWLPIIKELRDIRRLLADFAPELQALREDVRGLKHAAGAVREAAVLTAQDAVLLGATRYSDPRNLARFQAQVYSRHAEDGIVAEIFRRIGTTSRRFVEIGVGDGLENNTRFLLQSGWSGAWIEGSPEYASRIRTLFASELGSGRLRLVEQLVTKENVAKLFADAGVTADFDFLSIDVDMNTHHVWEGLATYRPRVACIEYNSSIPPSVDFGVPYDAAGAWTDGSNYFGAGLKTLERIGAGLGYRLVGCDYLGVDAFFVRAELCDDKFLAPFTAEFHYEPPRYGLHTHRGHASFTPRRP